MLGGIVAAILVAHEDHTNRNSLCVPKTSSGMLKVNPAILMM